MKRIALLGTVILTVAGAGCDGGGLLAPKPTDALAPQYAAGAAGASGCYTVLFNIKVPAPSGEASFTGPVTGDLEGTVTVEFSDGIKFTGGTIANAGTATWSITGGVIPAPLEFTTSFQNRNLLVRPPELVFENQGKHWALSGVAKANLTYKGTFDATLTPPLADHDYHGVICP